jgi:oligoribonuclease NrnB/cAMP/cGMP phosphodiesterase (DHH superfamily)
MYLMERTSDAHCIHRYQKNEQSPLILTEFTEHKQDLDIWRFKYSSFLNTGTPM